VATVIGVTNVIPFFGPFIGAIPCSILIFLVNPLQCIYFVIFILVLQQFDGNILGPKILGDSTGLDAFWVLFSILLFGGLFGFAGMLLGVPVTAVIYRILRDDLQKKEDAPEEKPKEEKEE
jgi:predicted PurR-regulated permease PerM